MLLERDREPIAALEPRLEQREIGAPRLQHVFQVEQVLVKDLELHLPDALPPLWPRRPRERRLDTTETVAPREAHGWIERVPQLPERHVGPPDVVRIVEPDAARRPVSRARGPVALGVVVPDIERLELQVLVAEEGRGNQIEIGTHGMPIERPEVLFQRAGRPPRVNGADRRLAPEVPLHPTNREVLGPQLVALIGTHLQEPEIVRPSLSGEAAAEDDRHFLAAGQPDGPAEERDHPAGP